MGKFDHILQPPFSQKIQLLVDTLNVHNTVGWTRDVDKILFNIKHLSDSTKQEYALQELMSPLNGFTLKVGPAGYYTYTIQLAKDFSEGAMHFYHIDLAIPFEELLQVVSASQSLEIAKKLTHTWQLMRENQSMLVDEVLLLPH